MGSIGEVDTNTAFKGIILGIQTLLTLKIEGPQGLCLVLKPK